MVTKIIQIGHVAPAYLYPEQVGKLLQRKSPTRILKDFREFVEARPNYFNPLTPMTGTGSNNWQYDPICLMFFFEHRQLLMDGNRTLKFKNHIEDMKEKYHLYTITQETSEEIEDLTAKVVALEELVKGITEGKLTAKLEWTGE